MRKLLGSLALCLALGGSAHAQLTPAPSSTGNITTNAANCNTTNVCVVLHMASSNVGYSVGVSGTWTGTLTVEQSADNQTSWASATTTTANTTYSSALTPGITDVRVRGSAAMTGAAVVTITASGPATLQQITQAGGGVSSVLPGNISPLSYGAVWDVQVVTDCTFTASTTVNCTGGEAPFKSSDVGKIFFGTKGNGQNNGPAAGQLACPQTTISAVNSATQIVLAAACTVACTPSGTTVCSIAWGTADDTAAINNAANAAWGGNVCRALELPGGYAFFSATIMGNNAGVGNACGGGTFTISGADLLSAGPAVYGRSSAATKFIPLPNFTYPCTGGVSGKACVFGIGNGTAHDFSVDGLNQDNAGSPHNVNLFELTGQVGNVGACPGGYTAYNLALGGWNLQSSTSQGLVFGANSCNLPILQNVNVMQFGAVPCAWNGGANTNAVYGLICFGGTGGILNLNGTGILNSYGGMYLALDTTNTGILNCSNTAATFNSHGDQFLTGNNGQIYTIGLCNQASTQTWTFDHSTLLLAPSASATSQCFFLNSTITVHLRDSKITCTGANNRTLFQSAGDKLFDDGGNTIAQGSLANSISGAVFGSGSATGTTLIATNITASTGWGTSGAAGNGISAPAGDSRAFKFTVTAAGTPAANPTLAVTFPTVYPFVAPNSCSAQQIGGTGVITALTTTTGPSTTSVTFTWNGTPVAASTYVIQGTCSL